MKLYRELFYQAFVLFTVICITFVAWDMGSSVLNSTSNFVNDVAQAAFSPLSESLHNYVIPTKDNHIMTIYIPAVLFVLATGGYSYVFLENLRLLRHHWNRSPVLKCLWLIWIAALFCIGIVTMILSIQLLLEGVLVALIGLTAYILILASFSWLYGVNTRKR
ncbi:MAG: hypothetical protein ACOZCL_17485 [Bacillota bacterium]